MHMQGMLAEEIYERLPYDPRWEFTRERLILGKFNNWSAISKPHISPLKAESKLKALIEMF